MHTRVMWILNERVHKFIVMAKHQIAKFHPTQILKYIKNKHISYKLTQNTHTSQKSFFL